MTREGDKPADLPVEFPNTLEVVYQSQDRQLRWPQDFPDLLV
jgi:hypothetical protein